MNTKLRIASLVGVVAIFAAACGSTASPTASPAASPSKAPAGLKGALTV